MCRSSAHRRRGRLAALLLGCCSAALGDASCGRPSLAGSSSIGRRRRIVHPAILRRGGADTYPTGRPAGPFSGAPSGPWTPKQPGATSNPMRTRRSAAQEQPVVRPLDELLDRSSRVVFVRRVYGLLSGSLGLTAVSCLACAAHPRAVVAALAHPGGQLALTLAGGVAFFAPLALGFSPGLRRDASTALPLFAAFAVAESLLLGVACTAFRLSTVVLAVAQTALATVGLTAYGFQPNPRYDLTGLGSVLFASVLALVFGGIVAALFDVPGASVLYSTLGAILFSAFIVYDTQLVVGGEKKNVQLDTRDYVLGATMLYLDVANLFIMLLRLADGGGGSDE